MKRWMIAVVVVALLAGCGLAVYMRAGVASVNGERIMPAEFYKALQVESGKQVLDRLILEKLIRQEAKRQGITVTDAEIDKELSTIKSQFPSEADFEKALSDSGMTRGELIEGIRVNEFLRKISLKDVTITEEEIQKYYNENKDSLGQPAKIKAKHILVKTREEAEAVLKRIRAGEDFATLAAALSTDPGSKDKGGDLGFITPGEMEEEFDKAAFNLKPGEVSDIVQTSYGFHIIKVEAREEAKPATIEESRERIVDALESQKAKPMDQVISEIRAASNIKVFWERYKLLEHTPEKTGEPEKTGQ